MMCTVRHHGFDRVRDYGSRLTIAGNPSPTPTELDFECARIFKKLTGIQSSHHKLVERGKIRRLDMVCPRVKQIQVCENGLTGQEGVS